MVLRQEIEGNLFSETGPVPSLTAELVQARRPGKSLSGTLHTLIPGVCPHLTP